MKATVASVILYSRGLILSISAVKALLPVVSVECNGRRDSRLYIVSIETQCIEAISSLSHAISVEYLLNAECLCLADPKL